VAGSARRFKGVASARWESNGVFGRQSASAKPHGFGEARARVGVPRARGGDLGDAGALLAGIIRSWRGEAAASEFGQDIAVARLRRAPATQGLAPQLRQCR
jgi:hypothetical protein